MSSEERRRLGRRAAGVRVRAEGDDEEPRGERFSGYAAVFDSRAAIGNPARWGFYEQISAGAFTKTLDEGDARMLIDHDTASVVSRVSADTLDLAQDDTGLAVDSALDEDLSYVRDLKANLRNGNITGMSIGFRVMKDDWALEEVEVEGLDEPVEVEVRTIREVQLVEVSAVSFPLFTDTAAELKQVSAALARRADPAAVERRAAYKPELRDLVGLPAAPRPAADLSAYRRRLDQRRLEVMRPRTRA